MITLDAFKATVQDFIERQDGQALPRPGELMLVGHAEGVGWKRGRIKPPYTWVAGAVVQAFIDLWKIDQLAIVVPGEAPRQYRVAFAERNALHGGSDVTDRRLARLVAAAEERWSRASRPLRPVLGRPWPVPLLSALLLVEVGPFVIWVVRHGQLGSPLSDAYYALIAATAVVFWLQVRFSNVLALTLAGVQVARTLVIFIPLVQANGFGVEAFWLWGYLAEPALILLVLWHLYARRERQ